MIHVYRCIALYRCIVIHRDTYVYGMYRYCSVSPCECKCIHLYRDTLVRYIGIQHTYTSMKPNETAIHQMYRTSIQLYIFPHVVTEPQYRDTVIQRDTAIQRYNAIHRYTCITTPQGRCGSARGRNGRCGSAGSRPPKFIPLNHLDSLRS